MYIPHRFANRFVPSILVMAQDMNHHRVVENPDYTVSCTIPGASCRDAFLYYIGLTHLLKAHPLLIDVKVIFLFVNIPIQFIDATVPRRCAYISLHIMNTLF
jgi:hypothetical protein